jgi:hypothetical protein
MEGEVYKEVESWWEEVGVWDSGSPKIDVVTAYLMVNEIIF